MVLLTDGLGYNQYPSRALPLVARRGLDTVVDSMRDWVYTSFAVTSCVSKVEIKKIDFSCEAFVVSHWYRVKG